MTFSNFPKIPLLIFFLIYIKMSKNLSARYYQENKERLQKSSWTYQNLPKEEKEQKWHYGRECYKNLSKDEKNKLVKYTKKIL